MVKHSKTFVGDDSRRQCMCKVTTIGLFADWMSVFIVSELATSTLCVTGCRVTNFFVHFLICMRHTTSISQCACNV